MHCSICIVGGGAAGAVAAISAARTLQTSNQSETSIVLLEANDSIGKKLAMTGNGKCNYLNEDQNKNHFHGDHPTWITQVLSEVSYEELIDFFKELGIYPVSRKGYLYPRSEQASSFVWALQYEMKRLGVHVLLGERLRKLEPISGASDAGFHITTRQGTEIDAERVILCTGGCASPKTGSDGSGYYYAKLFHHEVKDTVPALCPLYLQSNQPGYTKDYLKTWSGVRLKGCVHLQVDDKEQACDTGEVLLTAYGISGIPTFQVSHWASRALSEKKRVSVVLDVFPELSQEELGHLLQNMSMQSQKSLYAVLRTLLPEKFIHAILKKDWMSRSFAEMTPDEQKEVRMRLKKNTFTVVGTGDFSVAQVSAGGVLGVDIEATTMESKKKSGLYFAGELLDVHGDCGGYNLQWAWVTGMLAGKHAAQSCMDNPQKEAYL